MMGSMIKANWPFIAISLAFSLAASCGVVYLVVWAVQTLAGAS